MLTFCCMPFAIRFWALRLLEITPESSRTMDAAAYLNGLRGEKIEFLLRQG